MPSRASVTGLAVVAFAVAPLGAQAPASAAAAAQSPAPVVQLKNPACDCATGEDGRELRNVAAFAPLGFIGALAAAGAPALFGGGAPAPVAPVAIRPALGRVDASTLPQVEVPTVEAGRTNPLLVAEAPAEIKADSLTDAGLRAPDTATPLPSVLLLGSGLVVLGAFALARARG
jgi:hypothetical protein